VLSGKMDWVPPSVHRSTSTQFSEKKKPKNTYRFIDPITALNLGASRIKRSVHGEDFDM
jgi:hypothetical protein